MEETLGENMEEKRKEIEISLKDFWEILRRCWWLMLIVAMIVAAALYGFLSITHKDEYTAHGRLLVLRETESGKQMQSSDVTLSKNLLDDFIIMVKTERVLDKVSAKHDGLTTDQLKRMISVSNDSNTHFIDVAVTSADPALAQELSGEILQAMSVTVNEELFEERFIDAYDQTIKLPEKPSNPISKVKVLAVALGAALVIYAIYFVLFLLDDKINDAEDVKKYLGISILGQIPDMTGNHKKKGYGYYYYYRYTSDGTKVRTEKKHDSNGTDAKGAEQ